MAVGNKSQQQQSFRTIFLTSIKKNVKLLKLMVSGDCIMKKFLLAIAMFCVCTNFAFANGILKVKAVTPISTKAPSDIAVQVKEPAVVGDLELNSGCILYGKMVDVIPPQKMGKNAQFSFEILSFRDESGIEHNLKSPITIKYRQQMRPNLERSSFTVGDESGSGVTFSPYDIKLAKESSSAGEFLKKELIKDSPLDTGWEIELKAGDSLKFNLP